jgi:hypothetical protein
METPNDTCGSSSEFAANQTSGASQFVGDRFQTHAKLVSARIVPSAIVMNSLHPRDTDRGFGQSLAPRPAESICDENWDEKVQSFF